MDDLHTVGSLVEEILKTDKACRGDDALLYAKVCESIEPDISLLPFAIVLENRKDYGIPCFETVRRTRQKIQADDETLRPSKGIQIMRDKAEEEFKAYALE